jgi:hypothetical protein
MARQHLSRQGDASSNSARSVSFPTSSPMTRCVKVLAPMPASIKAPLPLGTVHGRGGEGSCDLPRRSDQQDVGGSGPNLPSPRGCSDGANIVIFAGMERAPSPIPTLEQLRRGHPWCWVVCERCLHRTPIAFVPLIIRWGPDASSDVLRRSARCTKCGRKGAVLQHPSWAGMDLGWEPFPAKESA